MKYAITTTAYEDGLCVSQIVQNEDCELDRGSKVLGYRHASIHITKGLDAGPIMLGWGVYPERDAAWASIEDYLSSCYVGEWETLFVRMDK